MLLNLRLKEIFVEYQKEPLGLDESAPRFSWLLESGNKNTVQTAYQIAVRDLDGRLCGIADALKAAAAWAWNMGEKRSPLHSL